MDDAFRRVFAEGARRAILIGTDIPGLNTRIIDEHFASLDQCDMTIGPSNDGGYYLIGFRNDTFSSDFFYDIEWSTNAVYQSTTVKAVRSGLDWYSGDKLSDVDEVTDLYRVKKTPGLRTDNSGLFSILDNLG